MRSASYTTKHAPALAGRRMLTFRAYLRLGGTAGMVRRIISQWQLPFTVNRVKIVFHYRHPELTLGDFQIDDIIACMVDKGFLERSADGTLRRSHRPLLPRAAKRVRRNKQMFLINL